MKKILTVLLAVVFCLSLMCVSVNAEGEAKNYLSADWGLSGQVKCGAVEKDGDSYICTGFTNAWGSPTVDVFSAAKAACGDEEEVTLLLRCTIAIKWADDANAGSGLKMHPLFRAGGTKDEEWNDKYTEFVDEVGASDGLFKNSSGNIMFNTFASSFTVTDDEPYEFEAEFTVSKGLFSSEWFPSGWQFCFDNMASDTGEMADIASVTISNTSLYIADEYYEANATPTPEPTPTPTPTPEATPTPQATATPTATAKADTASASASTSTTAAAESGNSSTVIIIVVVAVVVVAAAAAAFVVIKKKKGNQ